MLDKYCPSHTILGTNTSSLDIDEVDYFLKYEKTRKYAIHAAGKCHKSSEQSDRHSFSTTCTSEGRGRSRFCTQDYRRVDGDRILYFETNKKGL